VAQILLVALRHHDQSLAVVEEPVMAQRAFVLDAAAILALELPVEAATGNLQVCGIYEQLPAVQVHADAAAQPGRARILEQAWDDTAAAPPWLRMSMPWVCGESSDGSHAAWVGASSGRLYVGNRLLLSRSLGSSGSKHEQESD
jgi:hypothetical protein